MRNIDPDLLDPARYPSVLQANTRYSDVDNNRHLNNVTIAAHFEDARARIDWSPQFRDALGEFSASLVTHTLDYLAELVWPDPLTVHFGISKIGNSSWSIASLIVQHGQVCAVSRCVMVCIQDGRPAPLPQACREIVTPYLLKPTAQESAD